MREFYSNPPRPQPPWGHPGLYGELVSIAAVWSRRDRGPEALEPEALVHETWLRLTGQALPALDGPSHLVALATREMRRVRIDHVRARRAAKRGGGRRRIDLSDVAPAQRVIEGEGDLAVLLARMAVEHPRWARIVELRWTSGCTVAQVAARLGLSPATVEKDSRRLRLWLERELARAG